MTLGTRLRAAGAALFSKGSAPAGTTALPAGWGSQSTWWGVIRESFAGAWQNNVVEVGPLHTTLACSAVYSCVSIISDDISKLPIKLMRPRSATSNVLEEVRNHPAFGPVLRKPNQYQTTLQFLSQWVQSKLVHGNAFVYLERDARRVVVAMYVLNPRLVTISVGSDGSVWYSLSSDKLNGLAEPIIVPATDILHDRMVTLFHPLVGVSPIFACAVAASQNNRIQATSSKVFENLTRPSGVLVIKRTMKDEDLDRLKAKIESGYGGANVGRLMVTDSDVDFKTWGGGTVSSTDAQLIEQLRWTTEDVARAFHMPMYKLAADAGTKFNNLAALNQDYYRSTLQVLIEAIEALLNDGLGLTAAGYSAQLDLSSLLRMEPQAQAEVLKTYVSAGVMTLNEAREALDLQAQDGGDVVLQQAQMRPLSAILADSGAPAGAGAKASLERATAAANETIAALKARAQRDVAREAADV